MAVFDSERFLRWLGLVRLGELLRLCMGLYWALVTRKKIPNFPAKIWDLQGFVQGNTFAEVARRT